jgi:hypothetical protein
VVRIHNDQIHRLAKQHEAADNLVRGGLSVRFRVVVYAWPDCEEEVARVASATQDERLGVFLT